MGLAKKPFFFPCDDRVSEAHDIILKPIKPYDAECFAVALAVFLIPQCVILLISHLMPHHDVLLLNVA